MLYSLAVLGSFFRNNWEYPCFRGVLVQYKCVSLKSCRK